MCSWRIFLSKLIAITGASSGLGLEIRRLYTELGYTVCNLSRTNPDGYDKHFFCDVTDEQSVIKAFKEISDRYGKISRLFVNAGIGMAGTIEDAPTDFVKKVMDINFYGAYYTCKHSLKYLENDGRIINISSVCALFALPYRTAYCASKAALNMLSFGLAMELKDKDIKVCSVCPGEIKTEFSANRLKSTDGDEKYGGGVKEFLDHNVKKQHTRMSVLNVAQKIYRITEKNKIKRFYIIGGKYKVFYFFSKILPLNTFLKITEKYL